MWCILFWALVTKKKYVLTMHKSIIISSRNIKFKKIILGSHEYGAKLEIRIDMVLKTMEAPGFTLDLWSGTMSLKR